LGTYLVWLLNRLVEVKIKIKVEGRKAAEMKRRRMWLWR
jgi:hypothetical protein